MCEQHKISEYIENMAFKKKLCVGFSPDEVYEAICDLSAMYNGVLSDSYREIAELKNALREQQETAASPVPPLPPMPPPAEMPTAEGIAEDTPPAKPSLEGADSSAFIYQSVPAALAEPPSGTAARKERPTQLRHLSRRELLELLLECRQENERLLQSAQELSEQNQALLTQLQDKKLTINRAGTLAEASVLLNGVVESTNAAAKQYLDNLEDLYQREQSQFQEQEALARQQAQQILDEAADRCDALIQTTQEKCLEMESDTRSVCEAMSARTKEEIEAYWGELSQRLEVFYEAHEGLKSLLQNTGQIPGGGHG